MAFNLMESVSAFIKQGTNSQLSSLAGLNINQAGRSLHTLLPSLIGGFYQMTKSEEGLNTLSRLFEKELNNGTQLHRVRDILGGSESREYRDFGRKTLKSVFPGNFADVINANVRASKITMGSTTVLMSLLTPMVLSMIAKKLEGKTDPKSLRSFFSSQHEYILDKLPKEIGIILGFVEFNNEEEEEEEKVVRERKPLNLTWLKYLLPVLLLGGMVYAFLHFSSKTEKEGLPKLQEIEKPITSSTNNEPTLGSIFDVVVDENGEEVNQKEEAVSNQSGQGAQEQDISAELGISAEAMELMFVSMFEKGSESDDSYSLKDIRWSADQQIERHSKIEMLGLVAALKKDKKTQISATIQGYEDSQALTKKASSFLNLLKEYNIDSKRVALTTEEGQSAIVIRVDR